MFAQCLIKWITNIFQIAVRNPIVSPHNLYIEALTQNVMIFGNGDFGKKLGSDYVDRTSVLLRGAGRERDCCLSFLLSLPSSMRDGQPSAKLEGSPLWKTESARTMILDFPASRTTENTFLLSKQLVYCGCYGSLSKMKTKWVMVST